VTTDLVDVLFEVLVLLLEDGEVLLEACKLLLGLGFVSLPDLLNLGNLSL